MTTASLVLFVNGERKSFNTTTLSDNERESLINEIKSMFNNSNLLRFDDDDDEIETSLPSIQIPREIYTIYPQHPSFQNKLVQFRFKLDTETAQQTETRNEPFNEAFRNYQNITRRVLESSIPTLTTRRPGGPPPPLTRNNSGSDSVSSFSITDARTDADIDFLDSWDPP